MKILKRNVIEICKNSNVIINPADIEGCNRLPLDVPALPIINM